MKRRAAIEPPTGNGTSSGARIALQTTAECLAAESRIERVVFVLFGAEAHRAFTDVATRLKSSGN